MKKSKLGRFTKCVLAFLFIYQIGQILGSIIETIGLYNQFKTFHYEKIVFNFLIGLIIIGSIILILHNRKIGVIGMLIGFFFRVIFDSKTLVETGLPIYSIIILYICVFGMVLLLSKHIIKHLSLPTNE
jgi:hypothetical protein